MLDPLIVYMILSVIHFHCGLHERVKTKCPAIDVAMIDKSIKYKIWWSIFF
jgi:hypothetical protein